MNLFDRVVNFFGGVGNFVSSIFNALNPFKDDEDDGGGGGYRAPGPPGGGGYNKMHLVVDSLMYSIQDLVD